MSERHITPELYHLAGSGVVSPRTLARMVHEHVLHHCPECRAAWQALGGDRRALALLLETDPNPGGDTLPPPCGTAAPATAPLPDTGAACPPHREARPARSGGRPAEAGSYNTAFGRGREGWRWSSCSSARCWLDRRDSQH
ncbi:MAG TPA: hypothetical protein VHQ65_16995, partial [Thermoanaerobaculia bacterium]|nr:hypothetical protein [Thermoanaerobaculia bacterium]